MSWNANLLDATQITEGDFLKGNPIATWKVKPYDLETDISFFGDPVGAYDTNLGSYTSFRYSERDGSFTVFDFGHNYPSGSGAEGSEIVQVDLYLRYSANASAAGDRYRITYSTPYFYPNPPFTLVDWTSSATPPDTYIWTDIQDYDPFFPGWDWSDISNLEIAVETDRVGGDPNAFFREYEAWIIVTYKRPTNFLSRINQEAGWCFFNEMTSDSRPGRHLGVTGSGWLATIEFQVQEYGKCILNTTEQHPPTKLIERKEPPIPHTTENGYFSNRILGDVDGDRDVDTSDLLQLSKAYGSKPGDVNWISDCDFNRDNKVDESDLFDLCKNYGRSI